jgi:hypothetical protein
MTTNEPRRHWWGSFRFGNHGSQRTLLLGGEGGNQAAPSTTQDHPTRTPALFHMWRIDCFPTAVKLGSLGNPADKIWEPWFLN